MLLGDQNLTRDEVTTNPLALSLIQHAFLVASSAGLVDNQNRLHQDLVVVGGVGGPEYVIGFDNTHQVVRARIYRQPTGPEVAAPAAASAEAASAAASTRGIPAPPPTSRDPISSEVAASAAAAMCSPHAAGTPGQGLRSADVSRRRVAKWVTAKGTNRVTQNRLTVLLEFQ